MAEAAWRPQALKDLEAIEHYYSEVAPDFAAVFVEGVFESTATLADFPKAGRVVRGFGDPVMTVEGHEGAGDDALLEHSLPHIHARYQDEEVVVSIADGALLEGSLPTAKLKLLVAWVELHRDELQANWTLAASGQHPFKIDPLR